MEKEKTYSQTKNNEKPLAVKEVKIQEVQIIQPITKLAAPLGTMDDIRAFMRSRDEFIANLVKDKDIYEVRGKKKVKRGNIVTYVDTVTRRGTKDAYNKIAWASGISTEVINNKTEYYSSGKWVEKVWVKAILPNGQFHVAGGACKSDEQAFNYKDGKEAHKVYSIAETRARKRAIDTLLGIGEIELIEENEPIKTVLDTTQIDVTQEEVDKF